MTKEELFKGLGTNILSNEQLIVFDFLNQFDILKEPQALIEAIANVCEVGVAEVLDTYQLFRDDKIVELEY